MDPRYAYPQAHYTTYRPGPSDQYWAGGNYGMHAMNIPVPPPPMYDPSASARPPQYDYVGAPPPATMSKVDPAQAQYHPPEWTRRPAEGTSAGVAADVPPPAGPPPTSVARNETGRSETSNNPFARS